MKRIVLSSLIIVASLTLPILPRLFHLPRAAALPVGASVSAAQPVIWTNLTNCVVKGAALQKTAGRNDTTDAGANSKQQLVSGDGYLEFTALETNRERYVGFTQDYAGTSGATIDHAIHLTSFYYRGGIVAEVRENGVYKTETHYRSGTVFRIAVENGVVKYYRDGGLFYTSKLKPNYPLVVDAALLNLNATVSNALIYTAAVQPPPPPPPPPKDIVPPVLSAVTSANVTADAAVITWLTNEPANSQVEYGRTTAYGNVRALTPFQTTHRVDLIGLPPNTIWHYRVKSTDAAANQSTSGDFVFMTKPSSAGAVAGMLDDGQVRLPANYTNFVPPAVFTDSAYGTTITRLSNGLAQFNDGVHHEYATMSPFNRDNTRILLATHHNGYYVVDRAGNIIVPSAALGLGNSAEPRWSITNPNVFYFHEGNQLKKYELTTRQISVVRTFTQFSAITFGGGEADISEDGDHIIILGDGRYAGLYTFSTNTLGTTLLLSLGAFDSFDVTPNNNVIVRWGAQGVGRYKGFELFDGNMRFLRQVTTFGAHADSGRDLDGSEVLIIAAYNDAQPPPGCENNGVEKVRLSDGQRTCLVSLNWNTEIHVSANSFGKNPWVLVSTTDTSGDTAGAHLPSNWQSRWKVRYNELILVKLDGSERRRIAHHRSRMLDGYWFMPRAAISRDGKYALFDSNLGARPLADYSDSFLVQLIN
jgi:hypothetical protein